MKYCQNCGNELLNEAVVCPKCGCMTNLIPITVDIVNVPLCILSAFFPLFGLIYWAVRYSTKPKCAKACGITALTIYGIRFLLFLWIFVIFSS